MLCHAICRAENHYTEKMETFVNCNEKLIVDNINEILNCTLIIGQLRVLTGEHAESVRAIRAADNERIAQSNA